MMSLVKYVLYGVAFFAFTGLMPAAAQADAPAVEIFEDFCEEIAREAEDTGTVLVIAAKDKAECEVDLANCGEGLFSFNEDPVSCLADAIECSANAEADAVEACGGFAAEVTDAYADALRKARRQGPGVERRLQRLMNSRRGEVCLVPAVQIADDCNRQLAM